MEETRRLLRREQTEAEVVLWESLRGSRLADKKFRRQYSVGYFVLDFYCPAERLAIEADGNVHHSAEAQQYDAYRTEALNGLGIKVMRFQNEQILRQLSGVLKTIKDYLNNTTSPQPSP